jgi:hypothetical protein
VFLPASLASLLPEVKRRPGAISFLARSSATNEGLR